MAGISLIKAILGKCWEVFLIYYQQSHWALSYKKYLHNESVQSIENSVVIKTPRSINKILKFG